MTSSSDSLPAYGDLQEDEIRVLHLWPGSHDEPLSGALEPASITPCTCVMPTVPSKRRRRLSSEPGYSESGGDEPGSESGCDAPGDNESGGEYPVGSDARYRAVFPPTPHASVPYEAISYAWESSDKPCSIQIRNIGPIAIPESPFNVLRHLRYVHRCRVLWADAICIDQRNVSERNHQVAKMADIFSASTIVLVWLGAGVETDLLAFATIEICRSMRTKNSKDDSGNDSGNDSGKGSGNDSRNATGKDSDKDSGKDSKDHTIDLETLRNALFEYIGPHASFRRTIELEEDVALTALKSIFTIFQAKWFERMWVVQETNGLRDVVYFRGYHELSLDDLCTAFGLLADHVAKIRPHDTQIDRMALVEMVEHISSRYAPGHGGALTWHFIRYSARRCHDPKDRVYALRQNFGLEDYDELRPDYELDHVELVRRLVCVCLNLENRQRYRNKISIHPALILALVGTEDKPRSNPHSPSWVPGLHELTNASRAKMRLYSRPCLMDVHRGQDSLDNHWLTHVNLFTVRVMPESPTLLQFPGRCFAKAREPCSLRDAPNLGPQFSYGNTTTRDHVEAAANWFAAYCCRVADCVPGALDMDHERNLENFAFDPIIWNSGVREEKILKQQYGDDSRDLFKLLVARGTSGRLDLALGSCKRILDLTLQLPTCPLAKKRKLWRVQLEDRTDAAWVPDKTEIGDRICVVLGAPWPFVIRKLDENSYTLIGDAQVYGTSLMRSLVSKRQGGAFCFGAPLGLNTEFQPSDADMTHLSWITLR
jgi:hypothetical protein